MITLRGKTYWSDFYLTGGKRIRQTLRTADRAEANRRALALQERLEGAQPAHIKGQGPTLKEAFDAAMEDYEGWRASKSPGTVEANFRHVAAHFGEHVRLYAITRTALLDYAKTMDKAGLSGSTINQRLSLLSILFKQAELEDAEYSRPTVPRRKVGEGRIRTMSIEEERALLTKLDAGPTQTHRDTAELVRVLLDTGLRLSEALRVELRDIDQSRRVLRVWENKASHPRVVPLTPRAARVLLSRGPKPFASLPLFGAEKCWRWVRGEMGLAKDKQFVIHALRHTAASRLADAGEDAFRIQKFMGHKSGKTTGKYVHVSAYGLSGMATTLSSLSAECDQNCDQNWTDRAQNWHGQHPVADGKSPQVGDKPSLSLMPRMMS